MKNIKVSNITKFRINPSTYLLIIPFFLAGLIKNIILIYLIIIIHELGHIFIIKILKYPIIKVELYPYGGITTIEKKINTPITHDLLISIFGIIFQLFLSFLFYYLFKANFLSPNTYTIFKTYNKTILIFNLLPIIPLDGYHFLRGITELIFPYKKSFYLSLFISIITTFLFITYNHLYSLNNYLIITFLLYKLITSYQEFKYIYLRFLTERYLYDLPKIKLKYENKKNIALLKKDTYHYFKANHKVYSEHQLLEKLFKN